MLEYNLSWKEIKSKYSQQYVGLVNINKNSNNEIISADVVCSTKESEYENMLEQALSGKIFMIFPNADEESKIGVNA